MLDCVEGCDRKGANGFANRRGLGRHQSTCRFAQPADEELDGGRSPKRRRTELAGNQTDELEYNECAPFSQAVHFPPPALSRPMTRSYARRLRSGFRDEHDAMPEGPPMLEPNPPPSATRLRRQPYRTHRDLFGRYRVYPSKPLTIPDCNAPITLLSPAANRSDRQKTVEEIIQPCPNISTFYVQRHHWLGSATKSLDDRDRLCNDVLLQPDFNRDDIIGVNFASLDDKLANAAKTWDPSCPPSEGWRNVPLRLDIPPSHVGGDVHTIEVPGLRARSLLDIMRKQFKLNDVSTMHYEPFESYVLPPGTDTPSRQKVEIRDEMYTSPAMRRAHKEVQSKIIEDQSCTRPRCVAAYMFSSDGVQFGMFSHVKGWPILCSFGNVSKYERCKPLSNTCFPVAHVPTLPDNIKEQIMALHGKPPTEALLTHLRRELMQAVWCALLDDDFIHAWDNGIVIQCADGIERRVFPRIMTYSADYPEKVLIAAIRNLGARLCPRCLVTKESASQMGCQHDMRVRVVKRRKANAKYRDTIQKARTLIYKEGRPVQSKYVEDLLKAESYVPTMNAFSQRLGARFNIYAALVVDQLHEVELGVWKALFQHLIRLLHLSGNGAVVEFNHRFRMVPTFSSTIRLFSDDVASMGRLAARDFEDILQCCLPVFEGLLPPVCEEPAQKLLFILSEWHGLAKLRLHTTATLKIMKSLTTELGNELRKFADLTNGMDIRETPKEYARRRKQYESSKATAMLKSQSRGGRSTQTQPQMGQDEAGDGRQRCKLNLNTYKFHAIGDYVHAIDEYGTTDSYSTQIGELQNRKIKAQYARTNKRNAVEQMTRITDICMVLEDMDQALSRLLVPEPQDIDEEAAQSIVDGLPYSIGQKDRSEDMIPGIARWVDLQREDDAIRFFIPQVKRHLLARILGGYDHPDFNDQELGKVQFHQDRMYRHHTLRVNYTTYDVLRHQDVINPTTSHCFAVLPANFDEDSNTHPYIYAKVLGVYHAKVTYCGKLPRRMDFVHVRWLYYDYNRPGGWKSYRLDRLSYSQCRTQQDNIDAFDFVDPKDIIRASHLIPDFHSGTTSDFLQTSRSIAHDTAECTDWQAYYVDRFVDRDMLMRYLGGGVGHFKQYIGATAASVEDDPTNNTNEVEEDNKVILEDIEGIGAGSEEQMEEVTAEDEGNGAVENGEQDGYLPETEGHDVDNDLNLELGLYTDEDPSSKAPNNPAPPALSADELMIVYMREVEAELLRWEQYEWAGDEIMGTLDLVEFWKAHKHVFPLLHQVAMNILPVQASSVSSERAFSSGKMTCTRERNNISAEHMEHLQVLKHSLHRRRATPENHQTLDFMVHVIGEDDEDDEDD